MANPRTHRFRSRVNPLDREPSAAQVSRSPGGQTLPDEVAASGSGRLQLAKWITSAENPLTARVIVNRVWQRHFGIGIVPSTSDFGLRGEMPTHPELLDWLAAEFIRSGWSIKHLHRLIMNSRTLPDVEPGRRRERRRSTLTTITIGVSIASDSTPNRSETR